MSIIEAAPSLALEVQDTPRALLVRVIGQADLGAVDALRIELLKIVALRPKIVVLDFTDLSFISSLALGVLVEMERGVSRLRGRVRIAGAQEYLRDVLRYTRLDAVIEVFDTVDTALVA